MIEIKYTLNPNKELFEKWDFFIKEHPLPHFFQSTAYFKLWVGEQGSSPFLFYAEEDNNIIGVLCGVFSSNTTWFKKEFSKRILFIGGPLVAKSSDQLTIAKSLLNTFYKKFPLIPIFSEFRMAELEEIFNKKMFEVEPRCNILIETQKDNNAIFNKLSESKKRQINNSLKKGAKIEKASSEKDVKEFYEILSSFYKQKVKKPLLSVNLFLKFLNATKENNIGEILLIKYEEKIVAGIVCPAIGKGYVHEWYICGLDKEYKSKGIYPSVMATWAGINYAKESEAKYFDFMGAGKMDESYGVRNFKEKFGGETIITSRYIYIHKPILYKIGKMAIKLGLGG